MFLLFAFGFVVFGVVIWFGCIGCFEGFWGFWGFGFLVFEYVGCFDAVLY